MKKSKLQEIVPELSTEFLLRTYHKLITEQVAKGLSLVKSKDDIRNRMVQLQATNLLLLPEGKSRKVATLVIKKFFTTVNSSKFDLLI